MLKIKPGIDIRIMVDWHRAQRGLIGEVRQKDCSLAMRAGIRSYLYKILRMA